MEDRFQIRSILGNPALRRVLVPLPVKHEGVYGIAGDDCFSMKLCAEVEGA
jgi:hypothetical protein